MCIRYVSMSLALTAGVYDRNAEEPRLRVHAARVSKSRWKLPGVNRRGALLPSGNDTWGLFLRRSQHQYSLYFIPRIVVPPVCILLRIIKWLSFSYCVPADGISYFYLRMVLLDDKSLDRSAWTIDDDTNYISINYISTRLSGMRNERKFDWRRHWDGGDT